MKKRHALVSQASKQPSGRPRRGLWCGVPFSFFLLACALSLPLSSLLSLAPQRQPARHTVLRSFTFLLALLACSSRSGSHHTSTRPPARAPGRQRLSESERARKEWAGERGEEQHNYAAAHILVIEQRGQTSLSTDHRQQKQRQAEQSHMLKKSV